MFRVKFKTNMSLCWVLWGWFLPEWLLIHSAPCWKSSCPIPLLISEMETKIPECKTYMLAAKCELPDF